MPETITPLPGGCRCGKVFMIGPRIIRGIRSGHEEYYLNIIRLCERYDLFRYGIVPTRITECNRIPGTEFPLILEHERVPFITYAHEWAPSMFCDAAIFHIQLNILLGRQNLVLLDIHPYNILFNGVRPVYVDFPKIAHLRDLALNSSELLPRIFVNNHTRRTPSIGLLWVLFSKEFLPTFYRPLLLMDAGKHKEYRSFVAGFPDPSRHPVLTARECTDILPRSAIASVVTAFYLAFSLIGDDPAKKRFWITLHNAVVRLDVRPVPGAAIPQFLPHVVEDLIRDVRPSTLLDIGNRGAASLTAARAGCHVVAVDSDEWSMDSLYLQARREELPLTPLVINPVSLFTGEEENKPPALLLHPSQRLRCDMVVCGPEVLTRITQGSITPGQTAKILDRLSGSDLLISVPAGRETMTLAFMGVLEQKLKEYFTGIEELETPDDAYRILRCRKRS